VATVTSLADEQRQSLLEQVDDRTREILATRSSSSARHRRSWLIHRALAFADVAGLLLAFAVSLTVDPVADVADRVSPLFELLLFSLSLPLWIVAFKIKGLYDKDEDRTDYSTIDDVTGVFVVVTAGVWGLFLVSSLTSVVEPSAARLAVFWVVAMLLIPPCRAFARTFARSRIAYVQNVVIVGTGPVGRLFARKVLSHPEYGLHLVGFVDPDLSDGVTQIGPIPVLGSTDELGDLVEALAVDRVIVSFTEESPERTVELIRTVRSADVQIDIVPRMFEVVGTNATVHQIAGAPLVGLPRMRLSPSSRFLKRSLDLALTIPSLVLLAPALLVVAAVIKLDSRGPVFFRQVRRGEGESTFRIFKFRTMVADAEERKAEVAHLNMHVDDDPRMFKIPDDPRVTRVGRFLRRWSIDEVPQLLNVLKGEMSLVGPRPLILEEDQHVVDWARKRLSIKPGVTGLWQVLGRSDIPFEEMTKLDYLYVTSWSLKQDIRLILLTFPALFRPRRAS
jgi:exopolysaccharide biosynthesis polyprenyl glycosylphosphotransferase